MRAALALICLAGLLAASVAVAAPVQRDHLEVELVAERDGVVPGETVLVGLRLEHDPHWHTYWINPGDSGLPTKLAWTLPPGVTASDIQWPAPHRLPVGALTNFGYDGEMVLPVHVTVPADASAGTTVPLRVKASWLVCEVECIPGDAELSLDLPVVTVAPAPDARWAGLFDAARATWPQPRPDWRAEIADQGETLVLTVATPGETLDLATVQVFPVPQQLFATEAGNASAIGAELLRIVIAKSDYFTTMPAQAEILLRAGADGEVVRMVTAMPAGGAATIAAATSGTATGNDNAGANNGPGGAVVINDAPQDDLSAPMAVLLAFLGGLLLNLMPCVFPVLALKALGIAESAHDRARARRDGIAYLVGVIVALLALAGTLLALRAGGAALGWGFQLQVPGVLGALACLMVAVGLNLSGLFTIGGAWMGAGQSLTARDDARGAFFTGLLAVVVASPCTAPFMGPALGYAMTQPTVVALSVFLALAIGLALPLVLVSFVPVLARLLPRPGAWMDTLKQFLAFPMYLTALWLFWVLGKQTGVDGMTQAVAGAIALAFALWLLGRPSTRLFARVLRGTAIVGALLLCVLALSTLRMEFATGDTPHRDAWEPYSAERLEKLRTEGRTVLVNMTAAWCITCLANERVAIATTEVAEAMQTHGIVYLKGDWTRRDAAITAYLAQFGRNGVPLYVVYPRGGGAPRVLPQVLTASLLAEALDAAARGTPIAASSQP